MLLNSKQNAKKMLQVSKMLREARTSRSIKQSELADYLGVAQNTVSAWERGVSQIPLEMLQKIALHFSISIAELTGEAPKVQESEVLYSSSDSELRDIISRLRALCARLDGEIETLKARLKDKEEIIRLMQDADGCTDEHCSKQRRI